MQTFNIVKDNKVTETFRVKMVMNDFDVKQEHTKEVFRGSIEYPQKWNIGLIVGSSGTGKSTIINDIYRDDVITSFEYNDNSVLDNK